MTIKTLFKNPYKIIAKLIEGKAHFLNDKIYLNIKYKSVFNKNIDWKNPQTYNEKLQWLKVYDKNNEYSKLVDKYEVKKHVAKIIGEEYIIPTIDIYDKFENINFEKLPKQFVIKCTHDSGGLAIIKDKNNINLEELKNKINNCLKKNYYWRSREWPYKNIKPRIIIEKYINDDNSNEDIRDYKFFCFSGVPKYLFIASDRNKKNTELKFDYFDIQFNRLNMKQTSHPNSNYNIEKPKNYNKMVEIAAKLSKGFPQVRIDLYNIDGKIYFGEFTLFHHGGFVPFEPEKWDIELGNLIDLSKVKKNEK